MQVNETGDYYCSMFVGTTSRKSNAIRIIVFGKLIDRFEDYYRGLLPPEEFCKNDVYKNFVNFTGKHFCWNLFLIELKAFRRAILLKSDSNTSVFLRNLQTF